MKPIYPKGLKPYAFQLDPCVDFCLSRDFSYLGLDPGLGKTPIAAIAANSLRAQTVVICPPFLARNIEIEFAKWSIGEPVIVRLEPRMLRGEDEVPLCFEGDVLIVPDSLITRPPVRRFIARQAHWARYLGRPALLIADEAHRFKSDDAQRTKAIFRLAQNFTRRIFLSGTPFPNGPIELYPVISNTVPELIDDMTREEFGNRYCAGHVKEAECPKCHGRKGRAACTYCRGRGGFQNGYDFSGASNMGELKTRISPFMLRLRKEDVRSDLPGKTEEVVVLGALPPRLARLDAKLVTQFALTDLMAGKVQTDQVATYRRELGIYKLKTALDFLRGILEESSEKILVFAYHIDVVRQLEKGLAKWKPFVVTGATPNQVRHEYVTRFQAGEGRVFLGNYLACGVGLTLTQATRVVFVEQSWVDDENKQAADRTCQRIGQENDVHIQYLLYENSLDMKVIRANLRKRAITAQL